MISRVVEQVVHICDHTERTLTLRWVLGSNQENTVSIKGTGNHGIFIRTDGTSGGKDIVLDKLAETVSIYTIVDAGQFIIVGRIYFVNTWETILHSCCIRNFL